MKNIIKLSIIIVVILFSSQAFAAGLPRSLGMGGAFVAISDDISGIIENPAGLSFGRGQELSLSGGFSEIKGGYGQIGYRYTFGNSAAIGIYIIEDNLSDFIGPWYSLIEGRAQYQYLAYSQKIAENVSIGINLKGQRFIYPEYASWESSAYASDIGVLYAQSKYLSFGAVIRNALKTPVRYTDGKEYDVIERYLSSGLAWRPGGKDDLIVAFDVTTVNSTWGCALGLEWRPAGFIAFRSGLTWDKTNLLELRTHAGLGLKFGDSVMLDISTGTSVALFGEGSMMSLSFIF